MKRFAFKESVAVVAGLTGAVIVACSQGDTETPTTLTNPTSAPAATTAPGGNTAKPATSMTGGGGSQQSATPGVSGAASAAGPLMVSCTKTKDEATTTPDFPGVIAAWTAGDEATTICLNPAPAAGKICMEGNAADSQVGDEKYKNWGAALGLNLRLTDGTPWNAKALEIAALKFDIEVTEGSRPIRIQMGQVDDPAISKLVFPSSFASGACVTKTDDCNYAKNSFVYGGSNPKDQKATAAGVTVDLAKVIFPSWTKVPKLDANGMWPTDAAAAATGAATMTPAVAPTMAAATATMTPIVAPTGTTMKPAASASMTAAMSAAAPAASTPAAGGMPVYALATGQLIDLAKLSSLQFQVVTDPGKPGPYHFCVSNVKWLKADMTTEVVVAKRMDSMAAASGSAVSTAPAMTAPAMTGTAPMGSSTAPAPSGTSAAGNAVFEAAWGVFDANCTGCHNGVHGINKDKAKTQMMTKKDADDVVKAVTMGSSAGNVMPKGKPALSTTDIDKLKAWAASRM